MFTLAASNMILRGDGQANLHEAYCLDEAVTAAVKKLECDVGLLNLSTRRRTKDLHEFYFIRHMLECLKVGGTRYSHCAHVLRSGASLDEGRAAKAIVRSKQLCLCQTNCSTSGHYPLHYGIHAGISHATSNRKSWFGYWKGDGFAKTKHAGAWTMPMPGRKYAQCGWIATAIAKCI